MEIREASEADIPTIRELFQEYAAGLGVDLCFQQFDEELAGLPGPYVPPAGRLLVAWEGETPAGCVAFRRLDGSRCELKRLYVRPAFRGRGIQQALIAVRLGRARERGCTIACIHSRPGIPTERNAARLGFALAYHKVVLVRPGPGLAPSP